jgi:hypothetical protein
VSCEKVTLTVPAGADPNRVFWEHVRAGNETSEWRLTNPFTGEAMPLVR